MGSFERKAALAAEPASWLVFAVGSESLAVDLSRVLEIQEGREIFPVPLVTPQVLGVTYWREQALPVLSPAVLEEALGQVRRQVSGRPGLLAALEMGGESLGILFDRIVRVVRTEEIEGREAANPFGEDGVLERWGRYRDRALYRLNLERILERVRGG
jgi:chemotaxis signal transduction protein